MSAHTRRAEPGPDVLDGRLWFEASCGGRDYLVEAGGHTFPGRMLAWCAERGREYLVSLDEMGAMSDEARYFVRGYLAGNEPGLPQEAEEGVAPHDQEAWLAATARFRRTGRWYGCTHPVSRGICWTRCGAIAATSCTWRWT